MPAATVRFLGRDLSAVIASSYRRTNRSRTAWAQLDRAPWLHQKFRTLFWCSQTLEKGLCARAAAFHKRRA